MGSTVLKKPEPLRASTRLAPSPRKVLPGRLCEDPLLRVLHFNGTRPQGYSHRSRTHQESPLRSAISDRYPRKILRLSHIRQTSALVTAMMRGVRRSWDRLLSKRGRAMEQKRVKPIETEVEGHVYKWSDEVLKQTITEVESALAALRELDAGDDNDVEGHGYRWSDEQLKQAITKLDDALQSLRNLGADEDNDVEGHGYRWSDEQLKQAVTQVENALQSLRNLDADEDNDVEGHAYKWSDEDFKQVITKVESALEALRHLGSAEDAEVEGHGYRW